MQINKPLQNLACPALNGSDIDLLIFLHVSAEGTRKKVLIYRQIKPKPPSFWIETYSLSVPEVNSSVMKLKVLRSTSIQEV